MRRRRMSTSTSERTRATGIVQSLEGILSNAYRRAAGTHAIGRTGPRALHARRPPRRDRHAWGPDRQARLLSVHAWGVRVDVPRTPVDDASVRRLWHQRG